MISLRLSAKEYEALQALYPTYGARSVSDFARLAMKRVMGSSFASDDALLIRLNGNVLGFSQEIDKPLFLLRFCEGALGTTGGRIPANVVARNIHRSLGRFFVRTLANLSRGERVIGSLALWSCGTGPGVGPRCLSLQ